MVTDIVESSWPATGEGAAPQGRSPMIQMSPLVLAAANALREFLFQRVYAAVSQGEEARRARGVVRCLYEHYTAHPGDIPRGEYVRQSDSSERMALDYVSGMTDGFAFRTAEALGYTLGKG